MIKRLLPRKISLKLTLIYALLFSVVLVVLNAGTLIGVRYFLIHQAKSQVQNSERITMNNITSVNGKMILSGADLLGESAINSEINVRISDTSGKTINDAGRFATKDLSVTSDLGKLQVLELNDRHLIFENDSITSQGKTVAYLQITYNMQIEYKFISLLFVLMAFADLLGIIASILTGYLISRRILNPIDKMTKTAKSISFTDLTKRIEVGQGDDELSRLAVTFNEMIERLQLSYDKQSRFVSDASHELRTPIAVIQGYAGLIDRWGKDNREVLEESIAAIRGETESMTALIERLLFLARGESDEIKLQKEKVYLQPLIKEIINESRLIAPDHNLEYKADKKLELTADTRLLKQMLRALIDNAIKYTPTGGSILIDTKDEENSITISVTDTGIGIPSEEIPYLFDRFYRVDKTRSKDNGGSGLGLSIVKWIVDAHNGTINIASTQNKGTTVLIRLPK